ncbi:hypothetical protein ETB97_002466 [Aspergillus alliaceus]|uniref:Uncharacterized protein n=1 Tax=Petromyces alliaceus TaxID=209559 RepID=A0A5N7CAS4_PETAA|nr:uncharacterized protein BDW43DRAFT_281867 [Aspergillus alliaceus]KAB8231568.1 hypothetical protein BDW43DRAFT_281867 [Aspergillus alliaceus]KAE8391250.1 hypothetical protein BDV23DRAFT_72906 [Aspergillus alliaceus]KAF5859744.1 hypothetical protein ETB97_002466 [Aspergillus burnettii]
MANPAQLKALAYGSLLLSVGHALTGRKFQKLRRFQELPSLAYTCSTVGWYQGSGYLILIALLNFQWASNPQALEEPLNRAIAGLITLIAWGSSISYLRGGVVSSGLITAAAGAIHGWITLRN